MLGPLTTITLDAVEKDSPRARAIEATYATYDAKLRQGTAHRPRIGLARAAALIRFAAASQGLEQRRPLPQRDPRALLDFLPKL
eukprot:2720941-Prymnesium_polylepis.1